MLFDVYNYVFCVLGGVLCWGIYDNMCMVVDKVGCGKECIVNVCFLMMVSYYLFEVEFCNLVVGWEKG